MKICIQKRLLNTILLISTIFTFMLMSCNGSDTVKIKVSKLNNYSVLEVANAKGTDVIFTPVSSDTGSIGFKSGNELFWLTGKPGHIIREEGSVKYIWDLESVGKVELQVAKANEDVEFQLRLINREGNKSSVKWFVNVKASDDEYFTGALERVVDGAQTRSWREGIETALNLRNEIVEMKVKSTVAAYAPFYLSSNNYGFFVNGTWPGLFDFCKTNKDVVGIAFEGPEMSFKLYRGTPEQIVQNHARETGPSFIAPRWAFGPWRWRDEHRNNKSYYDGSEVKAPYNSDIVEDILMMQALDIPCTAYWIDRPWGTGGFGYDDFEVDYERLPEFEKMISWMNGKNIELMLWICPWVYGRMADTALVKGYGLSPKEMRSDFGMRQEQKMVVMDFTNPEAARWWGEQGPAKLAKMGVKGFKLDRGDGERESDSDSLKTFSGISYRENFNDYSRQFVKATYDAVKPILGSNFELFPRAQYTGSARYGSMWAGDTYSSAEGLRSALIALQRCAVMGYPLWTSDAGGYSGKLDREVTRRWIGFACFSPIMEIGPTNNQGFWGMSTEPSFDSELLAVWRFYTNLRISLVDYLHDLAITSSETGMPVARPLFLEYPQQPESWKDWRTYKLGGDLLVSVIWEKGRTTQKLYLPAGENWIDLWTKQEYKGGQYIQVNALPYQTPVFLRKGSNLVLPDFKELYEESVVKTSVKPEISKLEALEKW
ncbi:MAG: TIM-barrel domain-containing protein [Bacteroidales bacterium]